MTVKLELIERTASRWCAHEAGTENHFGSLCYLGAHHWEYTNADEDAKTSFEAGTVDDALVYIQAMLDSAMADDAKPKLKSGGEPRRSSDEEDALVEDPLAVRDLRAFFDHSFRRMEALAFTVKEPGVYVGTLTDHLARVIHKSGDPGILRDSFVKALDAQLRMLKLRDDDKPKNPLEDLLRSLAKKMSAEGVVVLGGGLGDEDVE